MVGVIWGLQWTYSQTLSTSLNDYGLILVPEVKLLKIAAQIFWHLDMKLDAEMMYLITLPITGVIPSRASIFLNSHNNEPKYLIRVCHNWMFWPHVNTHLRDFFAWYWYCRYHLLITRVFKSVRKCLYSLWNYLKRGKQILKRVLVLHAASGRRSDIWHDW